MFSSILIGFLVFCQLIENLSCVAFEKSQLQDGLKVRNSWNTEEEKMRGIASALENLEQRMETMQADWKLEKSLLESRIENKNREVKELETVVEAMKAECEDKNGEVANLKKHMDSMMDRVDKRLETHVANLEKRGNDNKAPSSEEETNKTLLSIEERSRELPYLMVCAFQNDWRSQDSTIVYDRITTEYNNADQPGGIGRLTMHMNFAYIHHNHHNDNNSDQTKSVDRMTMINNAYHSAGGDGSMDIKTGVFTALTSGFYIITYSASARVRPGESTDMNIHRNGESVEESRWLTMMASDGAASYIDDQGSRTVVGSIIQNFPLHLSVITAMH